MLDLVHKIYKSGVHIHEYLSANVRSKQKFGIWNSFDIPLDFFHWVDLMYSVGWIPQQCKLWMFWGFFKEV